MSYKLCFCVVALATAAYAKEPAPHQTGKLLQMESVECGPADGGNKGAEESRCQEYLVQMDNVIYRIRPRNEKHPVLLPVGTRVQFRLERDRMRLRTEDFSGKEREYSVLSVTPRADANTADVSATHLNHLQ
jgi:hypothetical protein